MTVIKNVYKVCIPSWIESDREHEIATCSFGKVEGCSGLGEKGRRQNGQNEEAGVLLIINMSVT